MADEAGKGSDSKLYTAATSDVINNSNPEQGEHDKNGLMEPNDEHEKEDKGEDSELGLLHKAVLGRVMSYASNDYGDDCSSDDNDIDKQTITLPRHMKDEGDDKHLPYSDDRRQSSGNVEPPLAGPLHDDATALYRQNDIRHQQQQEPGAVAVYGSNTTNRRITAANNDGGSVSILEHSENYGDDDNVRGNVSAGGNSDDDIAIVVESALYVEGDGGGIGSAELSQDVNGANEMANSESSY